MSEYINHPMVLYEVLPEAQSEHTRPADSFSCGTVGNQVRLYVSTGLVIASNQSGNCEITSFTFLQGERPVVVKGKVEMKSSGKKKKLFSLNESHKADNSNRRKNCR